MLLDRYALKLPLSAITRDFSKKARVSPSERRAETTRAYRLPPTTPACLLRNRVFKKRRCVFVWRRAQARVNKVKHLSRVNGNINTPRRLRLETSGANERRTLTPQGWREGEKRHERRQRRRGNGGRFLSVEKVESKRFRVDFNLEAVLKVTRAIGSSPV